METAMGELYTEKDKTIKTSDEIWDIMNDSVDTILEICSLFQNNNITNVSYRSPKDQLHHNYYKIMNCILQ